MNFLYNAGIGIFASGTRLAGSWNQKAKLMVNGQKETFAKIQQNISAEDRPIWVHAASLGEFEQGRPLIERIRKEYPDRKILLTFFSPSGYEVRKNYAGADVVCYLPFDTPSNAKRFINIVNPSLAVFVKYEFWGNYLQQLREHNIPTAIISAIFRPNQSFFKGYGGMFRTMLKTFNVGIFVQDAQSQELLAQIGVQSTVAGDTRFDRVTDILAEAKEFPNIQRFAEGKNVLVMGSSWEPDEDIAIEYINNHPELKVIIAPHEFRGSRIPNLIAKLKRSVCRYSELKENEDIDADVLIIDCYGILSSCYRYGTIAFIGGGFGAGIHNINEAAVYGIPVMFGPNHLKFKEAVDLKRMKGAHCVFVQQDFGSLMDTYLKNEERGKQTGEKCAEYIRNNIGATDKIFKVLKQYL